MICTTIEQSKKLAEILPLESADMYYMETSPNNYTVSILQRLERYMLLNQSEYYKMFPCWSLTALLELIPPYLGEFNEGIDFGFDKAVNGKWYSAYYLQYTKEGIKPIKAVTGDTAVDAVFEMIVWLKENKKM